jgi:hypothetical protein
MVAERVLARMRPMSEGNLHCIDAIRAVNCTLKAAMGGFERCPGASCPFWGDARCIFHDVKPELLARLQVADHLLELRDSLTAVRDAEGRVGGRSRFHRLLNEEQASESGDAGP